MTQIVILKKMVELAYDRTEDDSIIYCGDNNARVGTKLDFIESVDEVQARSIINNIVNDHGVSLINFCLQTNSCIINGRIDPLQDGYT